jgi:hypothetical protein
MARASYARIPPPPCPKKSILGGADGGLPPFNPKTPALAIERKPFPHLAGTHDPFPLSAATPRKPLILGPFLDHNFVVTLG